MIIKLDAFSLYAKIIALTVIVTSSTGSAISVLCSDIYNGHTYYLISQANWTESEAYAITLGGHLVTINDADENSFVYNTFTSNGRVDRGLWIGLNDVESEGNFVWASREPVIYTNWGSAYGGPPEPNNWPDNWQGCENYAHILYPSDPRHSEWNDAPDSEAPFGIPHFGIVEVPTAVPEPSSFLLFANGFVMLTIFGIRQVKWI